MDGPESESTARNGDGAAGQDDHEVDEAGDESFPASDPPASWSGPDVEPVRPEGASAAPE